MSLHNTFRERRQSLGFDYTKGKKKVISVTTKQNNKDSGHIYFHGERYECCHEEFQKSREISENQ